MRLWTSGEIAAATGGTASAEFEVSGVTFDSREVAPGDLFLAMVGDATDPRNAGAGALRQLGRCACDDFTDDLIGQAFKVNNPNATSSCGCGTSFSV